MNINRFHSILLLLALAFLLPLFSACRKKVSVPNAVPEQKPVNLPAEIVPQAVTPDIPQPPLPEPVEQVIAPIVAAAPSSLDLGEASFQARNYVKAAKYFDDYLKTHPDCPIRDVVLFRLGLSLALMDSSGKNMRRLEEVLKHLIAEYPGSPYKGPAELILGLQSTVESLKEDIKEKEARIRLLSEELQKLKEIDLERRPSRPNY